MQKMSMPVMIKGHTLHSNTPVTLCRDKVHFAPATSLLEAKPGLTTLQLRHALKSQLGRFKSLLDTGCTKALFEDEQWLQRRLRKSGHYAKSATIVFMGSVYTAQEPKHQYVVLGIPVFSPEEQRIIQLNDSAEDQFYIPYQTYSSA